MSVSDSDHAPRLNYLATVYNGIDMSLYLFQPTTTRDNLVFLGRIHPDKGAHLAIEVARRSGRNLIIAGIVQDLAYFEKQVKPHIDGCKISYVGPVNVVEKTLFSLRPRHFST